MDVHNFNIVRVHFKSIFKKVLEFLFSLLVRFPHATAFLH